MTTPTIHNKFKLNGKSFTSVGELLSYSEAINSEMYTFFKVWFNRLDFIEVATSGSTGKPKQIKLSKKAMQNSALATANFFNIFSETKALLCMPIKYIAGKMMLVRALELGWHLDVVEPKSNPLESSNKEYDFSAMIPLQVQSSIKQLNQIKMLIIGGGAISEELLKTLQHTDCECFATYGMTETATHIAVK
ncbi:MAG TPA: AMP-binding protein, partial [Flavobacteriaceae bacterium]|nr:AMP-binding protein [Flavobacteriaceae bacterium]